MRDRSGIRPVGPSFLLALMSPPLRGPDLRPGSVAAAMRSRKSGSCLLRVATPCSSLGHPCGMIFDWFWGRIEGRCSHRAVV